MSKPKKGKRFRYKLETLLKVRDIRETQQKEVFQAAERKVVEEQEKEQVLVEKQDQEYATLTSEISGADGNPTNVQKIMWRQAHIESLKKQVDDQQKVVEEAETQKEEEKDKLVKRMIDKKIIEIDKDKTRWAWKKLMDKETDKFLDDIASVGFEKKRRQKLEEEGKG